MVVQRGTVKRGGVFVAGEAWGRVRSMTDEHSKTLKEAGPSMPVRISGSFFFSYKTCIRRWLGDVTKDFPR